MQGRIANPESDIESRRCQKWVVEQGAFVGTWIRRHKKIRLKKMNKCRLVRVRNVHGFLQCVFELSHGFADVRRENLLVGDGTRFAAIVNIEKYCSGRTVATDMVKG